jgi:hypothetical protein
MKKIYHFDDNQHGQMSKNYRFDFIEKLGDYEFLHFSSENINIEDWDNVDCVMIHDSFPDEDFKNNLIQNAKQKSIPVVIFSNQYTNTEFEFLKNQINGIKAIKKDRFYDNLIDFLESYKDEKKIAVEILAYSKNYAIRKMRININRIFETLLLKKTFYYNDIFSIEPESSKEYKDLAELFYFCYNGDFQNHLDVFENLFLDKNVEAVVFKAKINELKQKIIEKYE